MRRAHTLKERTMMPACLSIKANQGAFLIVCTALAALVDGALTIIITAITLL